MELFVATSIFIAGHNGMVGSAIFRLLSNNNDVNLIVASKKDLDLRNQNEVGMFLAQKKPDQIILAAAKVGGINANNSYPADFLYDNLLIQSNVIGHAHQLGIKKLLFLGSSCIYPKYASQPIVENSLLTGKLEPTNEPYAIAKIAGIKMCESFNRQYDLDYRSVMPTNLYGPGDNFDLNNSHVIPGLIRRFHEAKTNNFDEVVVWGTGNAKREFLHVDDMAIACLFVLGLQRHEYESVTTKRLSHINIGSGTDISIKELAEMVASVVSYKGKIIFDIEKPDGTPRKLLDISKLDKLGWKSSIGLKNGLQSTYEWYCKNIN